MTDAPASELAELRAEVAELRAEIERVRREACPWTTAPVRHEPRFYVGRAEEPIEFVAVCDPDSFELGAGGAFR
jgi:hypothetical protein